MVVDVALGEGGAEPAHEGASAGVSGERGAAIAVSLGEAVELGVEPICEVFALRGGFGDADGGLAERGLEPGDELLPGLLAAESAGAGECEVLKLEPAVEVFLLLGGCGLVWGLVEVELLAERGEGLG